MAYDPTDDAGKVRLLISDVGGTGGTDFIFSDAEIDAFLEIEGGVLRAAALALRTIAGNETQVSKRIKFLELSTDGPAVAESLRKLAADLDAKADAADDDDAGFEIANMVVDQFSRRRDLGLSYD